MRSTAMRRILLLMLGLLLALPATVAFARQPATPPVQQTAFTSCGPDIEIEGAARVYPDNVRMTGGCVTYEKDLQQYTIIARYVITAGTTIDDANTQPGSTPSEELAQIGQTTVTVESGELTVTVVSDCIPTLEGVCGTPGSAFVGKRSANGDVVWSAVTLNDPQALGPGDMIYLQDVIATFTASGPEDTVVTTFGVFAIGGGQGCPTACFHMP